MWLLTNDCRTRFQKKKKRLRSLGKRRHLSAEEERLTKLGTFLKPEKKSSSVELFGHNPSLRKPRNSKLILKRSYSHPQCSRICSVVSKTKKNILTCFWWLGVALWYAFQERWSLSLPKLMQNVFSHHFFRCSSLEQISTRLLSTWFEFLQVFFFFLTFHWMGSSEKNYWHFSWSILCFSKPCIGAEKKMKRAHSAPVSVSSFFVWLKCNVLHQNRGTVPRLFLCVTNDFLLSSVCCTARHWHDKHNTEQSAGMGLLEDLPCLLCRAQLRKKNWIVFGQEIDDLFRRLSAAGFKIQRDGRCHLSS